MYWFKIELGTRIKINYLIVIDINKRREVKTWR